MHNIQSLRLCYVWSRYKFNFYKKKKIPSEDSPEVVTERENAIYFESTREREKEQSKEKEEK